MCLSIPYKIAAIKGEKAMVKTQDNKEREIGLPLVKDLQVGDWVLVLNDLAVTKISAQEAKQIINLYKHE